MSDGENDGIFSNPYNEREDPLCKSLCLKNKIQNIIINNKIIIIIFCIIS